MITPAALKREDIIEIIATPRITTSCEQGPGIKTFRDIDFINTTNG